MIRCAKRIKLAQILAQFGILMFWKVINTVTHINFKFSNVCNQSIAIISNIANLKFMWEGLK